MEIIVWTFERCKSICKRAFKLMKPAISVLVFAQFELSIYKIVSIISISACDVQSVVGLNCSSISLFVF